MSAKEILRELVKFNTIEDRENEKIMDYIEQLLKQKGFETDYKTKCLIMSIKKENRLGFLGHTDTVKSGTDWTVFPLNMQEKNGKLFGLGVCDMKGGIAAILEAVLETKWTEKQSGIKLYFTYDEEINFLGIKELVNNKEKFPNSMIIGEPTNNTIMNGSKGLLEFKLTFNGYSAHSSAPSKGENAIQKCINFINELNNFYNEIKTDKKDIFETPYTTMNIGKITGGKSINIVPDSCEVLIDFRIADETHTDLIINKIEKLLEKYNGTYEILNNIKSFINKNEKINPTNFITEASFINSENRYILGAGPVNPHEPDEYITIESLNKLVEQYKEMIEKYCV